VERGADELSISVPAIPTVKTQIRSLTQAQACELAEQAGTCTTAGQIREGVTIL